MSNYANLIRAELARANGKEFKDTRKVSKRCLSKNTKQWDYSYEVSDNATYEELEAAFWAN